MHSNVFPLNLGILAIAVAAPSVGFAAELTFNRDVRPILAENCFACHGFDAKARKANRRLDTADGATAEIEGVRAVVPGNLQESDAWQRIVTKDADDLMPPPKSHKTLTDAEKNILKHWIEQGAKYQKHWSFEPPQKAPLPETQNKSWARNAIDAFVLGKLEEVKLSPAPEADRRTLARRVSLDLTGLPPSLEDVEAFVNDSAPDAYDKLVAKFMATPQWGEHRARYWLDAARYADTHGIHIDNYREIWPYRDWVIAAFNKNQPFDQFTVEQIAGDLLPNPTRDQLLATGFHRCNATTSEGGTIDEENLALYANDRVTTTSWVWLGLTANCAACHDHKFDPITMKDFYSMAAFFRNTTQPPKDGNVKDTKPVIYLPQPQDEQRFADLAKEIPAAQAALARRRTEAQKDFEAWLAEAKPEQVEVSEESLVVRLPLEEGSGVDVQGRSNGEDATFKATGPIEWHDGGRFGRAPAFSNNAHFDLGDLANFSKDQPFTVAAWVRVPLNFGEGTIVGRMDDRQGLQGWELYVQGGKFGAQLASRQPVGALRVATKARTVRNDKWQHVLVTYDGSGEPAGFRIFVDGKPQQTAPESNTLKGSPQTDAALRIGQRETKHPFGAGMVQDVRVYSRALSTGEARSTPDEKNLRAAFATEPPKRTPPQKASLLSFYVDNLDGPSIEQAFKIEDLENEDAAIRDRATVSHIQQEKPGPAMANILMRGAYDKVGEPVTPAGFGALHPMPPNAPRNRLGLAQWIISPENTLTARVTVNRFWQEIFGVGLVRTTEDFGSQGERPVNSELLDWLAVEFRDSGWDVKKLFTLIVTSSTYRQAATVTADKLEKDPQNRLLSRGPRFRMDAEMVRDYALAASGSLVRSIGGPSVKPYQPEGVWEAVAMPGSNTRDYKRDSGDKLYRRSLYTFWKRAAPPATMEIFNAPTRESCTVRRERTDTPLQALATLNDPQFVEAARRLAETTMKQCCDPRDAIKSLAAHVLLRPLSPAETEVVVQTEADLESAFTAHPQGAKDLISVGESKADPALEPPRLAALTMVASELLNLDEALNK